MRGYTEVTTKEELSTFENAIDGFVDCIVKDARLLNRGYVDAQSRSLHEGDGFDVQIVFQSQNVEHDVEVILCRVQSCNFDASVLEEAMACSIRETGTWPERAIHLGDLCCAQIFYRLHPKSGQGAILGPELPSSLAIPATQLKLGWRQCSECLDAWQEADETLISRCPACGSLTELQAH